MLVFNGSKSRCALPRQLSSSCSCLKASQLNNSHLGKSTVSVWAHTLSGLRTTKVTEDQNQHLLVLPPVYLWVAVLFCFVF